jgi:signal transduction histidine kinase
VEASLSELHARIEQRDREREALTRADAALYGSLRQEDIFAALFDVAAELLGADQAAVWTWDTARRAWVTAARRGVADDAPGHAIPPNHWLVRATFEQDGLVVEDAGTDPRLPAHMRRFVERHRIRAFRIQPIRTGDETFGAFVISYREPRPLCPIEQRLLRELAQRAGLAIRNARLYAREARRTRELEALYRADEALLGSLRIDDVFAALVDEAARLLDADKASVAVWDEDHTHLVIGATYGYRRRSSARMRHRAGQGITGCVAVSGQPIAVEDARHDPRVMRGITDAEGIRSLLHVPIKVAGTIFGVFGVAYCRPRRFTGEEERMLLALAQRAGLAIENARLYARAEERARELDILYRADEALRRSLRLSDVLQALVDVASDLMRAEKASVWVWDAERKQLVLGAGRGLSDPTQLACLGEADLQILRHPPEGDILVVEDYASDSRISPRLLELSRREGFRASILAVIRIAGRVFGVFALGYASPRSFADREARLLLALAQRAALAIENARLFEQAQEAGMFEERQRLARELHDAVIQTLFSAGLIADAVPRLWTRNPDEGRKRLEELRQLTRGALAEMRTLLLELRPSALTEVGLDALLRQLVQAMASHSGLDIDLHLEGQLGPLPPDVQIAFYRFAQEALNNVTKHAHATHADVTLRALQDAVALQIQDDGRGFDPGHIPPGHLGLGIMHERASAIGAEVQVESRPGHGARLTARWRSQRLGAVA